MSTTTATRSKDATPDTRVGKVAMKLEVITIPVSDIDRATKFYGRLGWRQDVTPPGSGVVQFTPPGSACSVHFGTNRTSAAPGSAQNQFLIVSDIQAARDELAGRGVEVSEIFHFGPNGRGQRARARSRHLRFLRHLQRSGRQQLAAAGDHDAAARPGRRRPRRRSVRRAIWRARFGVRRPPTASTRSAPASATRTGPTGTPRTWWRSRPGRSCRRDGDAPMRR